MKKILLLLIFIISYTNAQTYTFDYKLKIGSNKNRDFFKKYSLLINSANSKYKIAIIDKRCFLSDYDKNINYHFQYSQEDTSEKYNFINYSDISSYKEVEIDHIKVSKIEENKYSIECFEKSNDKKSWLKLIVKLKPYNDDLINFYVLDMNHSIQNQITESLKKELTGNYIIEDYIIKYGNGGKWHYFIEKIDKINLKITI